MQNEEAIIEKLKNARVHTRLIICTDDHLLDHKKIVIEEIDEILQLLRQQPCPSGQAEAGEFTKSIKKWIDSCDFAYLRALPIYIWLDKLKNAGEKIERLETDLKKAKRKVEELEEERRTLYELSCCHIANEKGQRIRCSLDIDERTFLKADEPLEVIDLVFNSMKGWFYKHIKQCAYGKFPIQSSKESPAGG